MDKFNKNMLPLLGVMWHQFTSLKEAKRFASWAERVTRNSQYPCECDIYTEDGHITVKVSNW